MLNICKLFTIIMIGINLINFHYQTYKNKRSFFNRMTFIIRKLKDMIHRLLFLHIYKWKYIVISHYLCR
jgi:hypothetical protein